MRISIVLYITTVFSFKKVKMPFNSCSSSNRMNPDHSLWDLQQMSSSFKFCSHFKVKEHFYPSGSQGLLLHTAGPAGFGLESALYETGNKNKFYCIALFLSPPMTSYQTQHQTLCRLRPTTVLTVTISRDPGSIPAASMVGLLKGTLENGKMSPKGQSLSLMLTELP